MVDRFDKIDKETIDMLRNAHMKRVQLTVLADQKANILMGIVLVALSVIVSNIAMNELDNEIAKLAFGAFCVTETIAVLLSPLLIVQRLGPKVRSGFLPKAHNPLYFKHFVMIEPKHKVLAYEDENYKVLHITLRADTKQHGLSSFQLCQLV